MSAIKKMLRKNPAFYQWLRGCWFKLRGAWLGLTRLVKNGSYMSRTYLVNEEKKLIYVANAKVASSSIKASMEGLTDLANYHEVNHALSQTGDYLKNLDMNGYADYYKFSFVRNPYQRLISCYENKYHTDAEMSKTGAGRLYSTFLYFDNYLFGFLKKDRGFKRFAQRVCRIPDRLADRHLVGQKFMLTARDGHFIPDFVGRMEELPDAYEPIRAKYDLKPLPHYNRTKKSNWMDYYDLATAKKVYARYKADIDAFGYGEISDKLMRYLEEKEKPSAPA